MFGNKFEKMGRNLGYWATAAWLLPHYKKHVLNPSEVTKAEYVRFLFGIPFLHLSICTWVVNRIFSNIDNIKSILDSMLEEHLHYQEKLKGLASIDKVVLYEPEMVYLRTHHGIRPNTSTSWRGLTELLFEYRQSEYLKSLSRGFSDVTRVNNPVDRSPTEPLVLCFSNHILISKRSEISTRLPLSLLQTTIQVEEFCRKRA